jgi:ribosomal protein L37AE/L43A
MAQVARCPSCGAPVEFKSAASILAVCDYCRSTLIRQGEDLADLGKMAALLEDRSPLQRGASGRWHGRGFALIGRIQLRYEQGLWNEWHLLFDDGKSGWLSEAGGEYVLTEPRWLAETAPRFEDLRAGEDLRLEGKTYTIANVLTAECVAGEGELPFKVGAGYPAPVADLRDEGKGFATLDYSDDPAKPLLFVGESVDFGSLAWSNLRQGVPLPEPTVKARRFACPSCGAPLGVSAKDVTTIGCGSCGALLDPKDERAVLARASLEHKVEPIIELGSRGKLRGEAVELAGFMRRVMTADGVDYRWSEYLLRGPEGKLLWLIEYDGHWNLARVLSQSLRVGGTTVTYEKQTFKHFQSYAARVDYVIGEFPWRVKLDETAKAADYIAPPLMLSREKTDDEVSWTLAEYIEPAEVQAAFGLKSALRRPVGVYANQPNPRIEAHKLICRRFWRLSAAALAVHFLLLGFGPGRQLASQQLTFSADDDEPQLAAEFVLRDARNRIELNHDTSVDNSWVGVSATLVNQDTGENWQAQREVSHYSGVEDGESWSEGSRSDEVVFDGLPAGRYLLAVESDMDAGSRPVADRLSVAQAGPRWSSLILLIVFLAVFPIVSRMRQGGFEVKRWAESDHPIVTSDGDDD